MKKIAILFLLIICAMPASPRGGNTRYVDMFIGTAGDNGQVDPAARTPYGMVAVCPDNKPRSHSGYDYNVTLISGISVNRLSGIGCGGTGGNISIKPSAAGDVLHIDKRSESASPGYYTAQLDNGVKMEFTATQQVAVERYTYPRGGKAVFTIDAGTSFEPVKGASLEQVSPTEITGWIHTGNTCNHGAYKLYFHLQSNYPLTQLSSDGRKGEFEATTGGKPLELRIALSSVDADCAREWNAHYTNESFGDLRADALRQWDGILSRVDVKGGSADDRKIFYTSLYRAFLSPAYVSSLDGRYLTTDGKIQKAPRPYYSSWSIWDSYRTKFPLITLLDPAAMSDICFSLTEFYRTGKKNWATDYEATPTVRTEHSICVLLDAWNKGITGFDMRNGYENMRKDPDSWNPRSSDAFFEQAADLWTLSGIASAIGEKEDAARFLSSADEVFRTTWERDFKTVDASFPVMKANGMYQGSKWQYRWALPQYLDRMAASVGGRETLAAQLEYFFDNNLNNQTNEPGIHTPFIFNRLGRPDLSQKVVTRMLTRPTTHIYGGNAEYPSPVVDYIFKAEPEGFLPEMDEDDGTMGSWYVLASIGLFPLVIGEDMYQITSPLFDRVTLSPGDGASKITIKTAGRKSPEDLIKRITFNGAEVKGFEIPHTQLVRGGVLLLEY